MDNEQIYSKHYLEKCSYRFLQQTAKRLGLPSNVKKAQLIQLVHVKKNCSNEQVENLVERVREERKHIALARKAMKKSRKKHVHQSTEVSSTSNTQSPPITTTPIRVGHIMIRYSPEQYTPIKRTNRTISQTNSTINVSDRVLRSYRGIRKPSFILNNTLIGILKNTNADEQVKTVDKIAFCKEIQRQKADCESLLQKKSVWSSGTDNIPVRAQKNNELLSKPLKCSRRLSGIYPLNEESSTTKNYVSIRRPDGTLTELRAFIQKSQIKTDKRTNITQLLNPVSTENHNTVSNIVENYKSIDFMSSTQNAVYYHKKIRAEQVRCLKTREMPKCVNNDCMLPKINNVFSKFDSWNSDNIPQPVYSQETTETSSIIQNMHNYETTMLENIYNLKNSFVVNQPLAQVSTTVNTYCTFSTPVMTTAKAHTPVNMSAFYNTALQTQDSAPHFIEEARVHDFFRNFRCDDDGVDCLEVRQSSSSVSSLSQEVSANVTMPEMVEDAFEVISQDGDYMERMGMDITMQCILCDWAGPKMFLEIHIRKEHPTDVIESDCNEWHTTYTLGALATGKFWHSKVLDQSGQLFVLSTKYDDPDCLYATLSTLSGDDETPTTGSITTYNKITGEPFSWKGVVQQLSPTLYFDQDKNCLKLELSKLDLLPNSANIKLLNRELVAKSPTKVVVGQPELNNILITIVVKLTACDYSFQYTLL